MSATIRILFPDDHTTGHYKFRLHFCNCNGDGKREPVELTVYTTAGSIANYQVAMTR